MNQDFDVIIVGAGPAGSATGYFLARKGLRVLLLDKAIFPRPKICGDGLTPRALGVLRQMGLADRLDRMGFTINGIDIVGPRGSTIRMGIPAKGDLPGRLLTVPRLELDAAIQARAQAAGAEFAGQVRVTDVSRTATGVVVHGQHNGQSFQAAAPLAVIATGADVGLLKRLAILPRAPAMLLAARTYFEGVTGLGDRMQVHFDGVPLPGYGWIFPISDTVANVGLGFWPHTLFRRSKPRTAPAAFEGFVHTRLLRTALGEARAVEPVKGYPIRIDFPTAPTYSDRILLVGEAIGLVNPLTGEGIDFALENALIAADHIAGMFRDADFSAASLQAYDDQLREQFQRLFVFLRRIRSLYINPLLLNRFISVASRVPELSALLINIVLGHQDAADGVSARTIRKVILGH